MRSAVRTTFIRTMAVAALLLSMTRPVPAQGSAAETAAILSTIQKSAEDWNRGDIEAFATSYKNSPEIEFIGAKISHGYDGMLARYKNQYPTAETMGKLTFSQLDVKALDAHFATVTGWFHLKRTAAGGGDADG